MTSVDPAVASTPPAADAPAPAEPDGDGEQELVAVELLVEDVSIDGMCGVY